MNKKYIIIRDFKQPYILRQEENGRYSRINVIKRNGKYYTDDGIELNDSNTVESPLGFQMNKTKRVRFHDSFFQINYNDLYNTFKSYKQKSQSYRDPSENIGNDLLGGITALFRSSIPKVLVSLFRSAPQTATNSIKSLLNTIVTNSPKRLAQKATAKTLEAVIRETPRVGLGIVGSKTVDKISKQTTGKTFGQNVTDELSARTREKISPTVGELLNPGGYLGYNYMDKAIRKAFYNQVTPLSYGNEIQRIFPTVLTKKQEALRFARDIFNPRVTFRRPYTPTDARTKPSWRKRMEKSSTYSDQGTELMLGNMYNSAVLNNRDAAQRLALRIDKPNLYSYNGYGTFSYNIDNNYIKKTFPINSKFVQRDANGKITFKDISHTRGGDFDNITSNGGIVEVAQGPNGERLMLDVYDLQPYLDLSRPTGLPFHKTMNKIAPDFEVFNAVGGKPFTLFHSYNVNNPVTFNLNKNLPYNIPKVFQTVPNLIDIAE